MQTKQKIGIWGFSRVGSAAARYYVHQGMRPGIFDAHPLSEEQKAWCFEKQLRVWNPDQLKPFLEQHDLVIPSPGIDLRPYKIYAHKWVAEFDIFCKTYTKPIIAITGSIGKTSITHLLSQLLSVAYGPITTGGNIGIGMLDLLPAEHTAAAVVELSSFQLDLVRTAAPDLAIITNIYPNHLDRHGTLHAYMTAKSHIYQHQKATQTVLMPLDVAADLCAINRPHAKLHLFSDKRPLTMPHGCLGLFFIDKRTIYYADAHGEKELIDLTALPPITFAHNWLIITAAAYLLGVDLQKLIMHAHTFSMPAHRLEYIGTTIDGIAFFNDSKATTAESMRAAVHALAKEKNVHLFIGGLSKGVDREPALAQLVGAVTHAYCFGAEAETIHALCQKYDITSSCHTTLEAAFAHCISQVRPHETVLLSPGGASYDLFADYEERGARFIALVNNYLSSAHDKNQTT